jgi:ketosteroid isomerase-like protein
MKQFLLVIFVALFVACGYSQVNPEAEKQNILKCWNDWGEKAKSGDPGYYWTDDVVLMGSEGPTIKGKEEFMKLFSSMVQNPGFSMIWDKEPSVIEVSRDGQMAYLFAKNKVTFVDSTGTSRSGINQGVQIWKKDNEGNWKAAVSVMYPEAQIK